MTEELFLHRKWTMRAHGEQVVFVKRVNQRREHLLMKALLWALYLPSYPGLAVEIPIGDRFIDNRGHISVSHSALDWIRFRRQPATGPAI